MLPSRAHRHRKLHRVGSRLRTHVRRTEMPGLYGSNVLTTTGPRTRPVSVTDRVVD
jgi:hypothetical protein